MLYLEWQRLNNPNFKGPAGKKDVRPGMAGMGRKEKKVVIKWEGDEDGGVGDEGALEELVQLARVAGEKLARPGGGGGGGGVQKGFVLEGGGGGGGGVWRAASYEFSMVGDMLTKALAARPRAQPMGGAKGGGMGTAGKRMGLGINLGTGMGMGMGIGMGSGMGTVPMMAGGGFGEGFPAGMYSVTA